MARCRYEFAKSKQKGADFLNEDIKLRVNPVVTLSRLSEDEIRRFCLTGDKRLVIERQLDCKEELVRKGRHSSLQSLHSMDSEICDRDYASDSNSGDELPEVKFNSSQGQQKWNYVKYSKPLPESKNYIAALEDIFERQEKIEKANAEALKLEQELNNNMNTNASTSSDSSEEWKMPQILLNNDFIIDEELDLCDSITNCHPGKAVLDFTSAGKVFTRNMLTFENMHDRKTPMDETLAKASPDILDILLQCESINLHFDYITDKCAAIRLFFRLLSVHEDYFVALNCREMLLNVIRRDPGLGSCITLQDVAEVFINYGTTLDKILPVPELLKYAENLNCDAKTISSSETLSWSSLPIHCLENVMIVMRAFLFCNNNTITETPEHLIIIIIMLCNLALDISVKTAIEVSELKLTIDTVLQKFTDEQWSGQIPVRIAQYLASLSDQPQNLLCVAQMLFHSDRGYQLQRLTSYIMVNRLLNIEIQLENLTDVLPQTVLNFIKSVSWKQHTDFSMLYFVLMLIDVSVGWNFINGNWKTFEELSHVIKQTASGIKSKCKAMSTANKYNCSILKIDDLISRMHLKWHIIAKSAPVCQKTMFAYFNQLPKDNDFEDKLDM